MKRYLNLIVPLGMLLITLITTILVAFLLDFKIKNTNLVVGEISVSHQLYFTKGSLTEDGKFVEIDQIAGTEKKGIYFVNMDSSNDIYYVTNLNIDILVDSTVDTYIRVKIIDKIVLINENYQGDKTEYSIIINEDNKVDFNTYTNNDDEAWYYDELTEYYYFSVPVKKLDQPDINNQTTRVVSFVIPIASYNPMPPNYSMQIGLKVEGVQTKGGPQNNWGISPPWGGNWQ